MHLLIPYIQSSHLDPAFEEFTYGEIRQRAHKLKTATNQGDFIFFHTSISGRKFITAYYVVEQVLDTLLVCQQKAFISKYKNPHIEEWLSGDRSIHHDDDVILFGNPKESKVLKKPLLFDKELAEGLTLGIKFSATLSERKSIISSTRAWRELTDKDVIFLLTSVISDQANA